MRREELARARARAVKRRRRRKKNQRNSISSGSLIGVFVVCFLSCLFLSHAAAAKESDELTVVLKAKDVSIVQGEEKPVFQAEAECKGDTSLKLEDESGYTVQDLIDELNKGIGFTLNCEADGTAEGEYTIKPELTSEMTTPLLSEWFGKVKIEVKEGIFTVKNQFGEWEGKKFKRWDGTYVTSDFITYHNKTYYFDENSEKVTGWQEINGSKYLFGKKGAAKTGWYEEKKVKYYLDEDGKMHQGWLTLDDTKYYFDSEGRMVTGEQKIGSKKCVFAKDGKLESEESSIDPDKPMMALTFDDGPGPRTGELLDVLKQYNAHATFFMLGQNVGQYGDVVKRMLDEGNELGNHSYNHPQLTKLDAAGVQAQVGDTNNLISNASGQPATVMRPPYGAINDNVKANVGMPMIMWSIDTLDWKTKNAQATIDHVMNHAGDGDIVLLHDIHTTSVDAAIALIPKLIDAGYQLVTVSELAEARGVTMENGGRYSEFWKE